MYKKILEWKIKCRVVDGICTERSMLDRRVCVCAFLMSPLTHARGVPFQLVPCLPVCIHGSIRNQASNGRLECGAARRHDDNDSNPHSKTPDYRHTLTAPLSPPHYTNFFSSSIFLLSFFFFYCSTILLNIKDNDFWYRLFFFFWVGIEFSGTHYSSLRSIFPPQ